MNRLSIGIVGVLALAMTFSGTTLGAETAGVDDSIGDFADSEPGRHECDNGVLPAEVSEIAGTNVFVTSEEPDECTTGEHTRNSFGLSHGFSGFEYQDWEITVESWLRHAGDDRGFRCTFSGGSLSCAGLGGAFPPLGATYTHECIAYAATPDVADLYLRQWGCQVTY